MTGGAVIGTTDF